MSLYDDASLIQVPSLYKDGLLVSTVPEDRSGDFVFSRGSNLAATRVNSSGLIEKGYENLLLQSNSFDTTWSSSNFTLTPNQSGYDGLNNAWKTQVSTTYSSLSQNLGGSGVYTFSAYFRKGDSNEGIRFNFSASTDTNVYVDLTDGSSTFNGALIERSITDVGNGFYKVVVTANLTNPNSVRIFVTNGGTATIAGNIYVQDAMLNQGLVAYPYLETTTASVSGGILEDQPRLDYTNGTPALLIEPSRTNLVVNSEYVGSWSYNNASGISNTDVSPDGTLNAATITLNGIFSGCRQSLQYLAGTTYSISFYAKYKGGTNRELTCHDITNNTSVGAYTLTNEWQRYDFTYTPASQSTVIQFAYTGSTAGSIDINIWGAQVEQASYPTSYIPTYGTSVTRAKDLCTNSFATASSATLYNSFYSTEVKTLYILDQLLTIAVGENKLAFAFTPTTITISLNGSIVADATGTYDTTALASIQLGNDNGEDYSRSPISGFYVFPSVLTNTELNSLTV